MTDQTSRRNFLKMGAAGASMLPFLRVMPAAAQGNDTLVVVTGATINSLDLHRTGTSRA
ncbi:MAG: twin-arginine translocation signal domain-containing protein, partial [Pseudomonadota bacterium]|nr:twin-arginine translocation signal domain-containing protein [Pseudomonadota bacterium]